MEDTLEYEKKAEIKTQKYINEFKESISDEIDNCVSYAEFDGLGYIEITEAMEDVFKEKLKKDDLGWLDKNWNPENVKMIKNH